MRIMGLDIGEKIIGVAVSDELGITAQGLESIRRTSWKKVVQRLREIRDEKGVTEIVVGLPRRTDGQIGPEAEAVIELVSVLADELGVPVRTWDERFTTVVANQALKAANVPRRKRRSLVDEVAAAVILQGYLQASRSRGNCI